LFDEFSMQGGIGPLGRTRLGLVRALPPCMNEMKVDSRKNLVA